MVPGKRAVSLACQAELIARKLSDQLSRKGFLLSGIVIFLLGSGLAGASQTMDQPILFRALQRLGSEIGIGLVFTIIGDLFPSEERASKRALGGIVYGVSNLCGPTLCGWITDHGPLISGFVTETTRWRWLFYLNLPFDLLALLTLGIFLPTHLSAWRAEHPTRRSAIGRIDWLEGVLIVAATCCLLLGPSLGSTPTSAWTSPSVITLLVTSAVLYVLFFVLLLIAGL